MGKQGWLTMASPIHASSNPALFDITKRVKIRKKTTMAEMTVKVSTMISTRVPAGEVLVTFIMKAE